MNRQPEFYPDENKALLPWREYHLSGQHIAGATSVGVIVIAAAWYFDGAGDPFSYIVTAIVVAVLLPVAMLIGQHLATAGWFSTPVALDSSGIVAPILSGKTYVPWAKVRAIAHIHSMIGRSRAPIEYNLIVFPKRGVPMRLSLPELSGDERQQLFDILGNIARLHDIAFVLDHTPEGQRALKRLPWFWF